MTERTNPALWEKVKDYVMKSNIMGTKANEWSARKAQLAVKLYKEKGGEYIGKKSKNSLAKWTEQNWRTKSGLPSHITGERYLPEKAIKALTDKQYQLSSALKRKAMKENIQYSKQPSNITKIIKNIIGSGKSQICMPKSDYLAEHKHLNYLLSHPTQSGLKKEFTKQTQEVAMRGGSYALHAVIVHKPYPLEKAYQEAMSIMKITKPKFMRETQQSYRFRNIPKTKFQSKTFRTKVINPNISLIYGNLK